MSLLRNLRRSDGAVMVMGVFMAIGLVGAVWYVIGLGDALIYRDKMQEAADSVAFSGAVVHARGMNFIAAINLIMLVLVGLFLLIHIFEDFLQLILDVTGSCHGWTPTCELRVLPIACEACKVVDPLHKKVKEIRIQYHNNVLLRTLPELGRIQEVMQKDIVPAGTVAAGLVAGHEYSNSGSRTIGIALSPSMLRERLGHGKHGDHLGLPLNDNDFKALCEHVIDGVATWFEGKIKSIPVVGTALDMPGIKGKVKKEVNKFVSGLSDEYCSPGPNNTVWALKGFKTVDPEVPNGSDYNQVWGIVPSVFSDSSKRRVALPASMLHVGITPPAGHWPTVYIAQAEYYMDCRGKWDDKACNAKNYAMFSMKWRARLRRVHMIDNGSKVNEALNMVISGKVLTLGGNDQTSVSTEPLRGLTNNPYLSYALGHVPSPAQGGLDAASGVVDEAGLDPTIIH